MHKQLPTLQRLIRQLQHIPYLASKNLYRVAQYFLTSEQKQLENLCATILEAKKNIRPCKVCFNWTEGAESCSVCSDKRRDASAICVVETWQDLLAIEKTQDYRGRYHVLCGVLSPLEGVGPDDLTIDALLHRLREDVQELIFATNPTPEGEATASFIASRIENQKLKISRLASGVPIGSSLEYMDKVTIHKAMAGRQPF